MKIEKEILQDLSEMKETIKKLQQPLKEEINWLDSADLKIRFKVSNTTLWRLRKENKIPYSKMGNKFVYPESFFTKSLVNKMKNAHLL
ncbi:hypothetical protein [Flavobacterium koreense]